MKSQLLPHILRNHALRHVGVTELIFLIQSIFGITKKPKKNKNNKTQMFLINDGSKVHRPSV